MHYNELKTQTVSHIFPQLNKNKVYEVPGWNDQVLRWCMEAAGEKALKKEDYLGGFVINFVILFKSIFIYKTVQASNFLLHFIIKTLILLNFLQGKP